MTLTLNQVLLLVLSFAAVIVAFWLVLLMAQLRKTAREGQETLVEVRTLVKNLQDTSQRVHAQLDGVEDLLQATKKTATSLSEIAWFTATKIVRPSSRYWPFLIPVARFGWRTIKKRKKEDKNGK